MSAPAAIDQKDTKSPAAVRMYHVYPCFGALKPYEMGQYKQDSKPPAYAVEAPPPPPPTTNGIDKAAAREEHVWPNPQHLTIGIIPSGDDTTDWQWNIAQLESILRKWFLNSVSQAMKLSLTYEFVKDPKNAIVRFKFVPNSSACYSDVGKNCVNVPQSNPTTVIGLDADNVEAAVLHEFGHVLGFQHEHQHPLRSFKFNTEVVLADPRFKNWSPDDVTTQVLNPIAGALIGRPFYDPKSIMHYPYPASWIEGKVPEMKQNLIPSLLDRGSLFELYPPPKLSKGQFPDNPFEYAINNAIKKMAQLQQNLPLTEQLAALKQLSLSPPPARSAGALANSPPPTNPGSAAAPKN